MYIYIHIHILYYTEIKIVIDSYRWIEVQPSTSTENSVRIRGKERSMRNAEKSFEVFPSSFFLLSNASELDVRCFILAKIDGVLRIVLFWIFLQIHLRLIFKVNHNEQRRFIYLQIISEAHNISLGLVFGALSPSFFFLAHCCV